MLHDLYLLETFYGTRAGALFFADISRHYGGDLVSQALQSGDVTAKRIYVGPDCGRRIVYLTDQGRHKASHITMAETAAE